MYSELRENPYKDEEDDIALSLSGERNEYAAPLRDWLLKVVKRNRRLVCSEEMILLNRLLEQVSAVVDGFCSSVHNNNKGLATSARRSPVRIMYYFQ